MRLHMKNKATHWSGDGTLHFVWCVVNEKGRQLTGWMSHLAAEQQMGKMLAAQKRRG